MNNTIHLLCWSGPPEVAERETLLRYPDCPVVVLSQREFREKGPRGQLRTLRKLHGQALVFFFASRKDIRMPQVLAWSGLVHRCRETVLATASNEWETYRPNDWLKMFPRALLSGICDIVILCYTWILLRVLPRRPIPMETSVHASLDLAYLYPFPLDGAEVGGAMSHVHGFLGGLARIGGSCQIYAGRQLNSEHFPTEVIPSNNRFSLFPELLTLAYNFSFARRVRVHLEKFRPRALYQRHRRFTIAGALLSRWLRVPLILEFNGSEVWTAQFWDPTRFRRWLSLCEEFSLGSASLIVVVSEVLRDELVGRGIHPARVLVNPNGVDVDRFRPSCGGEHLRIELGIASDEIVAAFVGTFSYWHGVGVLQETILRVLNAAEQDPIFRRLKFLLIGEGPLFVDFKTAILKHPRAQNAVILCGTVAHGRVPSYLDAADILLSPHVPMPDGRPFFGSPTKLFEYMAMSKAIVASRLEQLEVVLEDQETALLVTPGNPDELLASLRELAADVQLRARLGTRAREVAASKHTWARNAATVLERLRPLTPVAEEMVEIEKSPIQVG